MASSASFTPGIQPTRESGLNLSERRTRTFYHRHNTTTNIMAALIASQHEQNRKAAKQWAADHSPRSISVVIVDAMVSKVLSFFFIFSKSMFPAHAVKFSNKSVVYTTYIGN